MTPANPQRKHLASLETDQEQNRFQVYTERQLDKIEEIKQLSPGQQFEMKVVANVLPFRVNRYVIEQLIDWNNIPEDPIFQLTFPQKGMLSNEHYQRMADAMGLPESLAKGSVVASDAFFPFADGLMEAAAAGATAVIQPGGSMRDNEVIEAADKAGLAMVLTGMRHFRH